MSDSLIETWRRIIIGEHNVTGHHPDILTYVSPDEVAEQNNDLVIGLLGRSKRDQDAAELMIIHVEDNRGVITQ
jgi:hypothetical protein